MKTKTREDNCSTGRGRSNPWGYLTRDGRGVTREKSGNQEGEIIAKKKVLTDAASDFAKKSFRFRNIAVANCKYNQDHLEKLLASIIEIYSAALNLPDVEPETENAPSRDHSTPLPALDKKDTYFMVLDPHSESPEFGCSAISMDLTEICDDLSAGLELYKDGHIMDALWQWRFDFRSHWSYHAASAINALNQLVMDF